MIRPTDQIVVIEKIVCCGFQEEGACHVIRGHERKPLDQGGSRWVEAKTWGFSWKETGEAREAG